MLRAKFVNLKSIFAQHPLDCAYLGCNLLILIPALLLRGGYLHFFKLSALSLLLLAIFRALGEMYDKKDLPATAFLLEVIQKKSKLLLVSFTLLYIIWCLWLDFVNPYRYEFNQGDAATTSQLLGNLVNGFNPELSWLTTNGLEKVGEDLRVPSRAYGYIPGFLIIQSWLPAALMLPLYYIYPHPPMHIFALQFWVLILGISGVYWSSIQFGGTKKFAAISAIVYVLLPQVATQLFYKAYMEELLIGLLPWFLGAIFSRRWLIAYLLAFLMCLTSYPSSQFVVIVGISVTLFFSETVLGIGIVCIGFLFCFLDASIIKSILLSYAADGHIPKSIFEHYVLGKSFASFLKPLNSTFWFAISLFMSVGFIPLLYILEAGKYCEKKNRNIASLLFIVGLAFVMLLFRGYGWEFYRNALLITPIYYASILGYQYLRPAYPCIRYIFAAGILPWIFIGNPNSSISPIGSHLPWGGMDFSSNKEYLAWRDTLNKMDEFVPKTSSIAWSADPEVHAILANRRDSWSAFSPPKEVQYYIFIGSGAWDGEPMSEMKSWLLQISKIDRRQYHLLYEGNPGKPLLVFKNLKFQEVPRNEALTGWNALNPWGLKGDNQNLLK